MLILQLFSDRAEEKSTLEVHLIDCKCYFLDIFLFLR